MLSIYFAKNQIYLKTMSKNVTKTTEFKNKFSEIIDNDVEYCLNDMKNIITDIYKTTNKNTNKNTKTIIKDTATIVIDDESSDDDDDKPKKRGRPAKPVKKDKNGNIIAKKPPSSYNLYVKEKIVELRMQQPDIPSKDRMSIVGAAWKKLTDEEKLAYTPTKKSDEDE